MTDLFRPIDELAALVRGGDVSAKELVDASLQRIETLDPQLNAFVHVDPEGARATADAIAPEDPRPFAGVPLALKEFLPARGFPLTFSSSLFGDFHPEHDAFVVRRLRGAGFVLVGVTNAPEFGIVPVTESRRHGPARNPWDPQRTPGGSSGGSAAAVAGGLVPVAHGSDGGGSLRIPAACCGLVGLKATRNRISRGPDVGDNDTSIDGALTRTVRETALMLDVLAGYELGDANWAPPPAEPFAAQAARPPGRLRIGLALAPPLEAPLHPAYRQATLDAGTLLESLGHDVEAVEPAWAAPELLELFTLLFGGSIVLAMGFGAMVAGSEPDPETVESLSLAMWRRIRGASALDYVAARARLQLYSRGLLTRLAPYDALLTPALAEPPVPLGTIDAQSDEPMAAFARAGRFTPYTAVANVTGQPAISLPLFHGEDGLPLGVQLMGRPGGEGPLLALAAQLETARPWAQRRPPVH